MKKNALMQPGRNIPWLFLFTLMIVAYSCTKEAPMTIESSGTWQKFTTADGLSSNNIRSLYEDKSGNIWVGTYDASVCMFDGNQWNKFNVGAKFDTSFVMSIIEDVRGDMWFGTTSGLLNVSNGSVTEMTDQGYSIYSKTFMNDQAGNLYIPEYPYGYYLLTANNSISYHSLPNSTINYNHINCIIQDGDGNIWFATSYGAIKQTPGGAQTIYNSSNGITADWVNTIMQDSRGDIWLGCWGESTVTRLHDGQFEKLNLNSGFPQEVVTGICEDRFHNIWFAAVAAGQVNYDGVIMRRMLENKQILNYSCWATLADKKGNIWFGTSGGLFRFTPQKH